MFENRLKLLLILMGLPLILVLLRLGQLQLLRAEFYRAETEAFLEEREVFVYPFVRGDITDHQGRRLAWDAPSWDVAVDFGILVQSEDYLHSLARRQLKMQGLPTSRSDREREIERLLARVDDSWRAVSDLTGTPLEVLLERRDHTIDRVLHIKERVSNRHGKDIVIKEELMSHAVAYGLDQPTQVATRVGLAPYPWMKVVASHTRRYAGGEAIGILLGYMGEVTQAEMEGDPLRDDPLAAYLPSSWCGKAGLEKLGETWLRGRRGREVRDQDGKTIGEPVAAVDGHTMRLTIDLPLQQAVYERLRAAVETHSISTGGSVVLLDIPSREVLALVSYPSVDPNTTLGELLALQADNPKTVPGLLRAIREYYQPGSTVKPMILVGALADGKLSEHTTFFCGGTLEGFHSPNKCLGHHGHIAAVRAIQKSCNIFFYHVAHLMGTERIAHWMSEFGFGRVSGTGLLEEMPGRLPDGFGRGIARLATIGQGPFDVTPIQMANMAATIAAGAYRPVRLWAGHPAPEPEQILPVPASAWRAVREGMYKVVNEQGGTAFGPHRAQFEGFEDYVLLGKTGSAQGYRRAIAWTFTCHMPDGSVQEVVRAYSDPARLQLELPEARISGVRASRRWPGSEVRDPTHAWFIGYLTGRGQHHRDCRGGNLQVAVAVVIEYGGHGGETASPVASSVIQAVLHRQTGVAPRSAEAIK